MLSSYMTITMAKFAAIAYIIIIPLKNGIMLLTKALGLSVCVCVCVSVCLSVCVSVCRHDCGEMAGLSNTVLHEGITYDNSSALTFS